MTAFRILVLLVLALAASTLSPSLRAQDSAQPNETGFTQAERDAFLEVAASALGRGHRAAKAESVDAAVKEMDGRAKERMERMLRGLRDRTRDADQRDLYRRFLDALKDTADADANNDHTSKEAAPGPPTAEQIERSGRFLDAAAADRAPMIEELDAVAGKLDKAAAAQWTAAALAAAKQRLKANGESVTAGGVTMRYHVEGEFKPGDPLCIYLHGGGANAQMNEIAWKAVFNVHKAFGFTAGVSARVPDDTSVVGWREDSAVRCIARMIDELVATHELDTNRVYIVGGSMGAWGISTMAPALADRVTAFCCHYGGGCEYRGFGMENTRNTPMCIGIGDADTQFGRLQGTRFLRDLLQKLHAEDEAGYDLHYEEWPGGGHAPGRGCEATFGKWMLERKRDPAPKIVAWQPTREFRTRFAWLERPAPMPVLQRGQAVRAEITENTIVLTGNAKGLILNLNDELVDLSQPVKVKLGDQTLFSGKLERSAAVILASVDASPDPARVYCARIVLP